MKNKPALNGAGLDADVSTFIFRKGTPGVSSSNIMFNGIWPKKYGKFPKEHPCSDDPQPTISGRHRTKAPGATEWTEVPGEQPDSDTNLGKFRKRGYWASCFPEGDGITFEPLNGQDDKTIIKDIGECFAVRVAVEC